MTHSNNILTLEFGDSRRFRRQIVAVSGDYSRQCGHGLCLNSGYSLMWCFSNSFLVRFVTFVAQ